MPLVSVRRDVPPGSLRVLYLLADQTGCGWYRCLMPGIYLRNLYGVDAMAATSLSDAVRAFAREADILVFQRQLSGSVLDFLHEHKTMGKKIVYEIDDDFWHLPVKNPVYRYYQADGLARLTRFIQVADIVTVSTEPLRQVVGAMHDHVVVLPNAVDPDLADAIVASRHAEPARSQGMVRIGWSGSNFHEGDLDCAIDALIAMAKRPDVQLVFFGWVPERIEREVPAVKVEKHPFVITNNYYHAMAALRLDIGVAPLRDNRFNEAKSNLKYLEYSMFRVPTVASPIYPYARTITDGEDGVLVKKNRYQEWLRQLTRLVEDRAERERLARNAYATVRERFHLKTAVRGWLDLYSSLQRGPDSAAFLAHRGVASVGPPADGAWSTAVC
ncbi:MAG: glycosyltransferase [Candidatus Methylomirabilis sp.]